MIELRQKIDRALAHRWLGPLVIVALVVMLVFVMLHTTIDAAHHEITLVCLAIAAVVLRLFVRPRQVDHTRPPVEFDRRGPPGIQMSFSVSAAAWPNPPPLRL